MRAKQALLKLSLLLSVASANWSHIDGPNLFGSYFGMPLQNATYDYVIAGGATAGLVVANRLA